MALEVGIVGLPGRGQDDAVHTRSRAQRRGAELRQGARRHGHDRGRPARRDWRSSSPPARSRRRRSGSSTCPAPAPQLLGNLRQVDALLAVAGRVLGAAPIPAADLETLELELLVADRDHVERRLERVEKQAKSGDPELRKEVEELRARARAPRRGRCAPRPMAGPLPPELEPLTTKPTARARERAGRHRPQARGGARRAARRGGGRVPRRAVGARRRGAAARARRST